jgi:tetratricopeptide (TPR) repeat protein
MAERGEQPSRGDPGELSVLLAELVAAPERTPPAPWERVLRPGARVGRFELVRELGRGGFGVVFEARDAELGRRVAFKAIRPAERARQPASEELLRREATAVAALQHPNIVTLFDAGRSEAGPYLILELLRGETLAQRLSRGRASAREAMQTALAVSRALVHAHGAGVVHRDLKPSNVFLTADGGVKVLDFGLAHVFGATGPAGSGTPGYMAPEQRRGEAGDARTDVHAVGVLIAEMITGARPGDAPGEDVPALLARARAPAALVALAGRCAAPDPSLRFPDAASLADALARVAEALDRSPRRAAGAPPAGAPAAVEALRHFFRGEECQARPVFGQDCADHYRRAVALDPTLAVAHYQLAVWTRRFGGTVAEQRSAIARAVRHQGRAPPLEQILIRAFAAHVAGREAEALSLFREAMERFPEDCRAFYEMGDLLRHQDELELSIPCFERAIALDPRPGWAPGQLAEALGALGRMDALRSWMSRWEAAPSPVTLHALAIGHGWLGDAGAAAAAAQRGLGVGAGLVAQQDLLGAMVFQGRYTEAEAPARAFAEPGSPIRRIGFYALAGLEAYRGRRRAGMAHLDALAHALPEVARDAHYHGIRADYLLGDGDPARVRAEAEALLDVDPRVAGEHAPALAWLGDLPGAERLARHLPRGSVLARTHDALVAWHGGERERALGLLRAVCAETPVSVWRLAPLYLLADLAARAGLDAEAIAALERCGRLYVPRMMWRSWTHARGLVLLARLRARAGDRAGAREALGRFFGEWSEADPAEPLLAEARALRAEIVP